MLLTTNASGDQRAQGGMDQAGRNFMKLSIEWSLRCAQAKDCLGQEGGNSARQE